jgi:hypothetical protein
MMRIDLRDEECLIAPALDRLRDELLASAVAVHFCGVDQGRTQIQPEPESCDLLGAPLGIIAHLPRPKAKGGHSFSGRQGDRMHRALPHMSCNPQEDRRFARNLEWLKCARIRPAFPFGAAADYPMQSTLHVGPDNAI